MVSNKALDSGLINVAKFCLILDFLGFIDHFGFIRKTNDCIIVMIVYVWK